MGPAVGVHVFRELRQTVSSRLSCENLRLFEERRGLRDLANFELNEPYVPNAALRVISEAQAISQNALAPPLPSTTS